LGTDLLTILRLNGRPFRLFGFQYDSQGACHGPTKPRELGPFHMPIVPMSVKAPVAASMLYMEMSFEAEFVT